MSIDILKSALTLIIAIHLCSSKAIAEDKIDDFFAMSPAELAATPIAIASGTPKTVAQSAAVTSVITAEQIKAMGATELHEVLETVPGLHVSIQENVYDYVYTMRGMSNGLNSEVLILLNGTRFSVPYYGRSETGVELPVEAIQRVEVIRGPGSALYGADAFAGVINIITKKAKDIDGVTAGIRGGSSNTQSAWGQFGGQWLDWNVAGSVQYQHSGGDNSRTVTQDAQTGLDQLFKTHASHAPSALLSQYERLDSHLNLQRKHWDIGFWAHNAIDRGLQAGVAAAIDNEGSANADDFMADMRFSTEDWYEDWEFLAHASYLNSNLRSFFQLFPNGAKLPIGSDGNVSQNPINLVLFPQGLNEYLDRRQQIPSFELSSIFKGFKNHRIRFSTGFRYEEITSKDKKNYGPGVIDGTQNPVNGTLTDVTGTPNTYQNDTNRSIWSAAAQHEWDLAKDWQLTWGVRFDNYSDFGSTVNPRAALVWNVTEEFTSKLLYGRAFRAPSFFEQGVQNNPVLEGNHNLQPETIDTIEMAFDYRPAKTLRTGINIYYYKIENLISVVPIPGSAKSKIQNSGDQTGYGSEFEWDWQMSDQWNLSGNYAWQNARNDLTDARVALVPEHHVYSALSWQFMPRWKLQTQVNWVGSRLLNSMSSNKPLRDYETVDLTLSSKKLFGHLNLLASVRNVLDADSREPTVNALPDNFPLPGRSFYLEASINY